MQSKLAQHHERIKSRLREGATKKDIADEFGVGSTTARNYIDSNADLREAYGIGQYHAPLDQAVEVSREEKLEAQLKELQGRARKDRTIDVQYDMVEDLLRDAIAAAEVQFEPADRDVGQGHEHEHVLLLSDLHAGEVVEPESLNGMNAFNWEILEERMERIYTALTSYLANRPYPIRKLHLWELGDMCSGSNHIEILETNEFNAAEQGVKVGHLLAQFIERLVPYYERIIVKGVAGNHPRVQQSPASKNVFNNFDWVAYKIQEAYLRDYPTVECEFPRAGQLVAEVAGHNVLLFHGDGIRSTMPGVPWGGVMRRVNELKKQYIDNGVRLDGFALGHFHQACAVSNIWMNGSVKGPDEYSLKQFGSGQRPTQLLLTFDNTKQRHTDVSYITP